MEGFIVVNKPPGPSSFKMVHTIRKRCGQKKVGHAGTLDPFASGILILGMGKAYTRQLETFQHMPKEYLMRIILGIETDTLDAYGTVTKHQASDCPDQKMLDETCASFIGEYEQTPPRYSAKKINGHRAYKLARNNVNFEIKPSLCTIYELKVMAILATPYPQLDIKLKCSKGTYARTIAYDLAKRIGTVATTKNLIRSKIGPYSIDQAIDPTHACTDQLNAAIFTTP